MGFAKSRDLRDTNEFDDDLIVYLNQAFAEQDWSTLVANMQQGKFDGAAI